jgi:hypothetical protein
MESKYVVAREKGGVSLADPMSIDNDYHGGIQADREIATTSEAEGRSAISEHFD